MVIEMDNKTRMITVATFAFLGVYCITCGALYPQYQQARTPKTAFLLVEQKQIGIKKEVNLKLKEMTTEVNVPLSVKIVDYLEEPVSNEVLAALKLDTSSVNVQQPGEYKYHIYYKKKVFEGKVIVKEKAVTQPIVQQTITLKSVTIKLGELLSTDLSTYIIEPLTEEQKQKMILDLTRVNPNKAGKYTYTISYDGAYYQGELIIIEDQKIVENVPGDNSSTTEQGKEKTEESQTSSNP